jgi:hypothetical protein
MKIPLSLTDTPFDEQEFARLWLVASATYGVGDVVTTIALVGYSPSVREANVVVRAAIDALGLSGLVLLKLVVFLVCLVVGVAAAQDGDRFGYYFPPLFLAVVGAFTTAYNIRLLVG